MISTGKIKKTFDLINPIGIISRFYINRINKAEFQSPPFSISNERPIEYCFVFEQIAKFYPKKILDVGTGTTALPHLMANCGCRVTAIDNIRDYWSRGMFNRHYYVINDSIVEPKLKDKFDLITCVSVLEHIENYNQAVASMFSLLKPGGHLVLTFPYTENGFIDNVYTLLGSNAKSLPSYKTHSFSRIEIEKWCKTNKAQVLEQEYWRFFTGKCWTVGERLSPPQKTKQNETHQISCILFKKL